MVSADSYPQYEGKGPAAAAAPHPHWLRIMTFSVGHSVTPRAKKTPDKMRKRGAKIRIGFNICSRRRRSCESIILYLVITSRDSPPLLDVILLTTL